MSPQDPGHGDSRPILREMPPRVRKSIVDIGSADLPASAPEHRFTVLHTHISQSTLYFVVFAYKNYYANHVSELK